MELENSEKGDREQEQRKEVEDTARIAIGAEGVCCVIKSKAREIVR